MVLQKQQFVDPLKRRRSWIIHKISGKTPVSEPFFKQSLDADIRRCSSKQLFLKTLQMSQESPCVGVFFNKVAGPQNNPAGARLGPPRDLQGTLRGPTKKLMIWWKKCFLDAIFFVLHIYYCFLLEK